MVNTTDLGPLEFSECLVDSPLFRQKLHLHEKELEKTNQQIKQLIKEVKDLLNAAKNLSLAQRKLSSSLKNFCFSSVTTTQTDDERVIQDSLKEFGTLIANIEDIRDKILQASHEQIIAPLERFRKENIGGVKEGKKKFEKQTAKFCQSQERYLNLSIKKLDSQIKEADATLDMEERELCQASMQYVFRLQELEELKKFEFVETLLSFLQNWFAFYHQGHDIYEEFKPYMRELQLKVQKTRENFDATRDQAESLMKKMLELRQQKALDSTINKSDTREGYLFLMEKKAFGTAWTKQFCRYEKATKEFEMIPFNQITSKTVTSSDKFKLASCTRRMSDSIEKRFCFDLVPLDRPGVVLTLQALSEKDRNNWMDVMDGIEPTYAAPGNINKEERALDDVGFQFVSRCLQTLESRGLEEQGLYRVVGVSSKVSKLLAMGLDRRKAEKLNFEDPCEWESKTITSALKTYLRHLPEPLMTFHLHEEFIEAAKRPTNALRVATVHSLVRKLPKENFHMLEILIRHLTKVAAKAEKNLMSVSNLGVCFGPSLLRSAEETVAAILNIKFCNIVVEVMIENYEKIFNTEPDPQELVGADPRYYSITNHRQAVKQQPIYGTAGHSGGVGPPRGPASPGPPMRAPPRHHYPIQHPVTHAVTKTYYSEAPSSINLQNPSPNSAPNSARDRDYRHDIGITERDTYWREPGPTTSDGNHHNINTHHMPYDLAKRIAERHEGLNSTSSSNDSMSSRELYVPEGTEFIARAAYARAESPDLLSGAVYARTSSPDVQYPPSRPFNRASPDLQFPPPKDSRASLGVHPPAVYRSSIDSVVSFTYSFDTNSLRSQTNELSDFVGVRRVRTLYACLGENDGELSFDPNQIITNVRPSLEPGWLEGTLNGKTGLIPENYVEILP